MVKKKRTVAYAMYFLLLVIFLVFLILHSFKLYDLETDRFTIYLLSVIAAVMLLPVVAHIKFFEFVDVRRDIKLFGKKKQ